MENICFGKLEVFDEEVYIVVWEVNVYEFIISFFEGYNMVVGEWGIILFGG